ncbi:MAG TPA: SAM-dependent methyltransferase [Pseudonocardia sp.]
MTGLPTAPNLHEVAQSVAPDSHVLYTDNDPIVLAHAQALLGSAPQGRTTYLAADMREPSKILAAPQLRETLDLSTPVALTVLAMMQTIDDEDAAHRVVQVLMGALPSGSYLAMSIPTDELDPEPIAEVKRQYEARGEVVRFRSKAEVEAFFQGMELVEPGIVQVHKWRPAAPTSPPSPTGTSTCTAASPASRDGGPDDRRAEPSKTAVRQLSVLSLSHIAAYMTRVTGHGEGAAHDPRTDRLSADEPLPVRRGADVRGPLHDRGL